ncbi:Na/Pi cotransporter family protein [Spirochaeta lutea]|uniref:Na/Pi cotransporter family protein n=1 Tax=Spirochaeta lutea TaxID=1480694 RepID=UPI00068A926D|nr:Na/Pi cotransporter family protein [Spirochaeta lutea]
MLTVIHILGSLGLFLYGMNSMGKNLQKAAGSSLQRILGILTKNRVTGVFTGFLATALIQSSSATTVIVVGLVHGGLMTLNQSIGVIMGANIGTTVTGWIIALLGFKVNIVDLAFFALLVGMVLIILPEKYRRPVAGEILVGFALLFIGLDFLKGSVPDIRSNPEIFSWVQSLTGFGIGSTLLFILFGTALTILVQSSSAAMAITLTLAFSGWIDFQNSAAIILGENIGTTVTAYLASLGSNVHSRRAARAHTLFNIFGVLWMLVVFVPFLKMVDAITPGAITTPDGITSSLAMFHTLFNILNTFICIWFVPQFSSLVQRIVKPRKIDFEEVYQLEFLDTGLPGSLGINLDRGAKEILNMARIVEQAYEETSQEIQGHRSSSKGLVETLKPLLDRQRLMHHEISRFLVECTRHVDSEEESRRTTAYLQVVQELDTMAGSIEKLSRYLLKYHGKEVSLGEKEQNQLHSYLAIIREFLQFILARLNQGIDPEELDMARDMENKIDKLRAQLKKRSRKRMKSGTTEVKSELLYLDILRHAEHLGDSSLRIAQALWNAVDEGDEDAVPKDTKNSGRALR